MAERGRSPVRVGSTQTSSPHPASIKSNQSNRSQPASHASERTPLLSRDEDDGGLQHLNGAPRDPSAASLLRSFQNPGKGSRRWPSVLALALLCSVVVLIMVLGFVAPAVIREYGMQAASFKPTSLSIDSFTASGVKARIQGDFTMDAAKVKKKPVRDLGRFGTWIARAVESGESWVEVSLPEYGNVILGTADVPGVKIDIRNGHTTHVDFLSDLKPGSVDGIRRIANDWIEGRLGQLRVRGKATVPLKSGIFSFGRQTVEQTLLFANKDIPTMPQYQIMKLNFREIQIPSAGNGMAVDVSLKVTNDYPVDFTVPPLRFRVLVGNCAPADPYIPLADASTSELHIEPKKDVYVNVTGVVRRLPDELTQACPGSHESPLDALLGEYIHGRDTTIYVRGSDSPSAETPKWISELLSDITVPVPFPGHSFGHLIRDFSLADVHFGLPDPFAEPNTPAAQPHISAKVKALVALPEEMNFNISVGRVRADADVFYHGKKLGFLDLRKWQKANSTRVDSQDDEGPRLAVESVIKDAPLEVTDDDVFTDVVQALVFGGKKVYLSIKADVDVEMETALGQLAVRKIPAEGLVPVEPINPGNRGGFGQFAPKIRNFNILETGKGCLVFSAEVNFTNPTLYSATVPFVDVILFTNETALGHATARDVTIVPGVNEGILVTAVWDPLAAGGEAALPISRDFLSQYISGWNTTLTLRTHEGSIPSQPALGKALAKFAVQMPTPSLSDPEPGDGNGDDDGKKKGPHFIEDATMHLLTSRAAFTLLSPLHHSIIYLTSINATAFYKGDSVGRILYSVPFAVPPGASASPRLPVDWSLGSVGYDAVKGALGGTLKLSAKATVGVRVGKWEERIWFEGKGIGAKVRL
ncbi:hypothetical protein LTR66_010658 [Elasticomyces elasticus]|nr:hypothetical protein LTR66_010658 [Elasticomyces elasticus]